MDTRTGKVFFACALGSFVGALTALQMNIYFWWVGMIVGGLTGYLSYEFKKVTAAIPQAWEKASIWSPQPLLIFLKSYAIEWLGLVAFGSTMFMALGALCWGASTPPVMNLHIVFLLWMLGMGLIAGATMEFKIGSEMLRYANPFAVFVFYPLKALFYWMPKGIILAVPRIPAAFSAIITAVSIGAETLGRFTKYLFVEIHSDERLLCGVDAAIGTAVGYFLGSAGIGALAGGLFGVLNYEVVSKRWLKLAPRVVSK